MINVTNIQKVFRTEEVETWALNNVSLNVKMANLEPWCPLLPQCGYSDRTIYPFDAEVVNEVII